MSNTFKGGIHPHDDGKGYAKDKAIERLAPPQVVAIPLSQHIGAPCEPCVAVGDEVKMGQKIGDSSAPVSAPVHSSVSGKVTAIAPGVNAVGNKVNCVFIENDFKDTLCEDIKPYGDIEQLTSEEIINVIRASGLVGMGGATFPTETKIRSCLQNKIDYVIINAAECEPYLTADFRVMVEQPEKVIYGLKALLKVFGLSKGHIGIEDNKPEAIAAVKAAAQNDPAIEVVSLKTKYPQGGEKQLIYAITGREVPSGKLPATIGAAVFNLGTCWALANAIMTGMPLFERVVSVTGPGIKEPKNLLVKVGTSFEYVIENCGGMNDNVIKVISGGPMMGFTQYTLSTPVVKGTSGILLLTDKEEKIEKNPQCIRCGKCVEACPMKLLPSYLNMYISKGRFNDAEDLNVLDCIECGACTFACPARLHITQNCRLAKGTILARRRAEAANAKK